MEIKIYTLTNCPYCVDAKEYFKSKGLRFEEIDASKPEKAVELIKISGQTGVPVIIINKKVILGFDKNKINEALKI